MKNRNAARVLLIFSLIIINISCDQVTKKLVRYNIGKNEKIILIKKHFILTNVENTGAFLSAGSSLSGTTRNILLSVIPLIVIGFGLYYVLKKKTLGWPEVTGLCFVIGGGIGNIYDRIVHGGVTDFMHIDFLLFQTGIFNMADLSIMTGFIILLFSTLKKKKNSGNGRDDQSAPTGSSGAFPEA